jgi:hypothetical protein
MALPTSYLVSTKNLGDILNAIQSAQAPPKFNRKFLENLGFTSSADRLIINVLKSLGLLASDGTPTERYFQFLDQTQAGGVLAQGIREGYADLYQLNRNAHKMSKPELKGKIKTLTQGKASDNVVDKMAMTFQALAKHADFEAETADRASEPAASETSDSAPEIDEDAASPSPLTGQFPGGLVYSIQIHLPESRDQAVYDALFRSLRAHLFQ